MKRLDQPGAITASLAGAAVFRSLAGDTDTARANATEGLALARSLGVPGLIARNLSALAGALADRDPEQARALLHESVAVFRTLDYENVNDVTQAVLVGAYVRDWQVVLECAPHSIAHLHWLGDRPQLAGVLSITARAILESEPETSAILHGISRRLANASATDRGLGARPAGGGTRGREFVGDLRRETSAQLDAMLGADRRLELRATGEAMDVDDGVAYALEQLRAASLSGAS
jgi:hypothetical protein